MRTFKDSKGESWSIQIDTTAVRNVRSALDVNLLSLPENDFELLTRLTTDPVLLVDVIYVVCRDQADQRGISDEQFGRGMFGDAIQEAAEALIEEIIDFFPDRRRRAMLAKVIEKGKALGNILMDRGVEKARELDEIDLSAEANSLIASFGNAQGSSA